MAPPRDAAHLAVLRLLAEALDETAARLAAVEDRVADLALTAGPDPAARVALQDLDLIRQTVADLGRLAGAAATNEPAPPEGLGAVLRLATLRDRLRGSGPVPPRRTRMEGSGDVDLFARDGP